MLIKKFFHFLKLRVEDRQDNLTPTRTNIKFRHTTRQPMKNLTKSEHQNMKHTTYSYITSKDRTFSEFKNLLFKYYILALDNTYDVEDPRTWKSVCIKCNSARSLMNSPLTCCFRQM
jgi:hypothetical protein